jgi:Tc5 transposase DNA-binding domain
MPTQNVLETLLLVAAAAGAANPLPHSLTADVTSEQWKAKFKYLDDNKGVYGSMRKAAGMAPSVPYTTLRGRYLKRATAPTSFGPRPMLGCDVESVIVDHCKQQHAAGFSVPKVVIIACAKKAAVDLGGADTAASIGGKKWYKGFMKRHPDVKEMNSSLMEGGTSPSFISHVR